MNTPHAPANVATQHVFKVSELNHKIKLILEDKFPFLWISGEISNFKTPSSGHCYFTLKDSRSQISAIIFRNQAASMRFRPKDGMAVIGLGRIAVYEPRGNYQIIFEYLEPKGVGNLQLAYEELKKRLAEEGLFDEEHKRPVPTIPKQIGVITSATGAAVRDFIKLSQQRFPNLPLQVVPVRVQGDAAPGEIADAIGSLNRRQTCDLIVLARGGGSIEDLWAFNDEQVARAIFASRIPVVSAIGHETDFTIADFVADLRAPTPSAAAELVVPSKQELLYRIGEIKEKLSRIMGAKLTLAKHQLHAATQRIVHPRRRLHDQRLRLEELTGRMAERTRHLLRTKRSTLAFHQELLGQVSPEKRIARLQTRLAECRHHLATSLRHLLQTRRATLLAQLSMLDALNPMAILKRGYSITRTLPDNRIVRSARRVKADQQLEVLLGSGRLTVTVDQKRMEEG